MDDIVDAGLISRRSLLLGGGGLVAAATALAAGAFDVELHRHPALRARLFGCGANPPPQPSDYVTFTGTYPSTAMGTSMPWEIAMPRDHGTGSGSGGGQPLPLVLALPGHDGSVGSVISGEGLPGWATQVGLQCAFVSSGNVGSTYYHPRADGTDCFSWLTDELIGLAERRFHIGGSAARRAVYGVSMGGFGSLLVGLKRPDLVSAVVGASPAVFPSYQAAITGHPYTFDSAADWAQWGVWEQAESFTVPCRIDCGQSDPFSDTARTLLRRIPGAVGAVSAGCHDSSFWRRNASTHMKFLADHLATSAR